MNDAVTCAREVVAVMRTYHANVERGDRFWLVYVLEDSFDLDVQVEDTGA